MTSRRLSLDDARNFAADTLVRLRTEPAVAAVVAEALVMAEASGLKGHGLMRLESYGAQTLSGKVNGYARAEASRPRPGALVVDAGLGFSYPAIDLAVEALPAMARTQGIAVAAIRRAHHAGAIGLHVERLAAVGVVGVMVANAPASIAPWGGSRAVFGTNPIALAAPRDGGAPVVVDLSVAKVARGNLLGAAQRGEPIPEGWALDPEGRPTTDARAGLAGTMLPAGDAKGTALALFIEILAAAVAGAAFSFEQSSYFNGEGPPPEAGHLMIAIDPDAFGGDFLARMGVLTAAIEGQDGARLPGARRLAARAAAARDGVTVDPALDAALARMG